MEDTDRPRSPVWLDLLIGLGAAGLGLLPWLRTSLRLPLQNLWAVETAPDAMPHSLVPLNQYDLVLVSALLVTGGALAALAVRLCRSRPVCSSPSWGRHGYGRPWSSAWRSPPW